MLTNSKLDRLFPPQEFNDSSYSDMLITKEKNIYIVNRTENTKEKYNIFDELFKLYLTKLPSSHVKNMYLIFLTNN